MIPAPFDGKDVPLSYSLSGRNCFVAKMAGTEQYMYHGAFSGYNEFSLTKVALVDEISTDAGSVKMYYSSRSQLPDYTSGLAMQKGQFPSLVVQSWIRLFIPLTLSARPLLSNILIRQAIVCS